MMIPNASKSQTAVKTFLGPLGKEENVSCSTRNLLKLCAKNLSLIFQCCVTIARAEYEKSYWGPSNGILMPLPRAPFFQDLYYEQQTTPNLTVHNAPNRTDETGHGGNVPGNLLITYLLLLYTDVLSVPYAGIHLFFFFLSPSGNNIKMCLLNRLSIILQESHWLDMNLD